MDDLQYKEREWMYNVSDLCFKPYYKWMTFNTQIIVLSAVLAEICFKPYYKWMTFNTHKTFLLYNYNYQISFKPYYKWMTFNTFAMTKYELMLKKF